MGLFSGITKTFKSVVKAVAKPVVKILPKAIAKPITQVATSISKLTPGSLLKVASQGPVLGPINFVAGSTAPKIAPYVQLGSNLATLAVNPTGATKMAVNIGGILGTVGGILGNTNSSGNQLIQGLSGALQIAGQLVPAKSNVVTMAAAKAPAAQQMVSVGAGKGIPADVANAGMALLNKLGIRVSSANAFIPTLTRALGSIASFARRTPAGSIVSVLVGMGIALNAANTMVAWYSTKRKRRRMNPANAHALRRAARRIKSFHKLCQHTDLIKTHRRSAPRRAAC
jgi:hypothetical protein